MPGGFSLVDLGKLAEPASKLVDKISEAIGGLCGPWQTRRMAEAKADTAIVAAETQIRITDLHRRALRRFVEEEAQRQENMETITKAALPQVKEDAKPEEIDKNWLTHFFDQCRSYSDTEMQKLWSKLLAGEANQPGSFSRQSVGLLSSLDTADAKLFSKLHEFAAHFGSLNPLVLDEQDDFYRGHGVGFESLAHLEDLGLIKFDSAMGFSRGNLTQVTPLLYKDRKFVVIFKNRMGNTISVGKVLYSRAGRELSALCPNTPLVGFIENLRKNWERKIQLLEIDSSLGEEAINKMLYEKVYGKDAQSEKKP